MKAWPALVVFLLAANPDTLPTPQSLQADLARKPKQADAERLAERIRTYFGTENLVKGAAPKVDELTVAWASRLHASVRRSCISAEASRAPSVP